MLKLYCPELILFLKTQENVELKPVASMEMDSLKKLRIAFTLLFITILIGVAGYTIFEGMTLFEAFYMTIITISTVGFQEVRPLHPMGRIITIFIISTGIMIGAYTIGTLLRMFIEGELRKTFGRRKVERKISGLKDHYIICGYGRIGSLVCQELKNNDKDFVVIDNDPDAMDQLDKDGTLYLPLDATEDESLERAGIMNAKALVTAVKSDADNVFITLTARGMRPDIFILSRASDVGSEAKLKRAGANRVVSPYLIGGKRMAQVLLKPTVVDFIDIAIMDTRLGLRLEECRIKPDSNLGGKNLIESNLRRDYGVIIVLIKKNNGEMIYNPQPTEVLDSNDVLVVLGKKEDMDRMNEAL